MGFLNIPLQTQGVIFNETFEFVYKSIAQISWLNSAWLVSRLDGSDLSSEAQWHGFWLGNFDLGLAWSNHGSMAQITTQWLRGSDLEMVLARDLNSVARWLGSILAHEDRIKQLSHKSFFFFFENSKFKIWMCFFFLFSYWSMPVFFFLLSPFLFLFFIFYEYCKQIIIIIIMQTKHKMATFFFFFKQRRQRPLGQGSFHAIIFSFSFF